MCCVYTKAYYNKIHAPRQGHERESSRKKMRGWGVPGGDRVEGAPGTTFISLQKEIGERRPSVLAACGPGGTSTAYRPR